MNLLIHDGHRCLESLRGEGQWVKVPVLSAYLKRWKFKVLAVH